MIFISAYFLLELPFKQDIKCGTLSGIINVTVLMSLTFANINCPAPITAARE